MYRRSINQKISALILVVMILLSGLTVSTSAAPATLTAEPESPMVAPANDNFSNAELLTGISGDVTGTNAGADKEAGEPIHAKNRGGWSIWYKYVAPGDGVLTIDTTFSNIDTLLAVYSGSSLSTLREAAANDDRYNPGGFTASSLLSVGTVTGKTYYIAVDGKNRNNGTATTGNVGLHFQFDNSPANDGFFDVQLSYVPRMKSITTTNVGASKQLGEPNHVGNAGGKSIWYRWVNNQAYSQTMSFTVESRSLNNPSIGVHALFAIYRNSNISQLIPVTTSEFTGRVRLTFKAAPFTTYQLAIDGFDAGTGAATGNFTLTYGVAQSDKVPDVDGDGQADLTVFRPSNGTWYTFESVSQSLSSLQFGANGDQPMIGDLDHDGKVDHTVFRPDISTWYLLSETDGFQGYQWGSTTDIPLLRTVHTATGDHTYTTVFRPATGTWFTYGDPVSPAVQFGQIGDVPVSADLTGDGTDEFIVFRGNGTWYILDGVTNQFSTVTFGLNGDKPVVADYDADGRQDIAVFRPSTGYWYFLNSSDNSFHGIQWGQSGDEPQPADFNGDGLADLAVYRNGTWYMRDSFNGSLRTAQFGLATDIPVSNPAR